jgi:hypothetical protein
MTYVEYVQKEYFKFLGTLIQSHENRKGSPSFYNEKSIHIIIDRRIHKMETDFIREIVCPNLYIKWRQIEYVKLCVRTIQFRHKIAFEDRFSDSRELVSFRDRLALEDEFSDGIDDDSDVGDESGQDSDACSLCQIWGAGHRRQGQVQRQHWGGESCPLRHEWRYDGTHE